MPKPRTSRFFRCLAAVCLLAGSAVSSHAAGPTAKAVFAGGCFWCVESDFDKVAGVISTTSGYTGGKTAAPTYEQVSAHTTGHAEAVEIVFDPTRVSYEKLVQHFWRTIDPTTRDRQFCDSGSPYRTNCGRDARLKQLWGDAAAH